MASNGSTRPRAEPECNDAIAAIPVSSAATPTNVSGSVGCHAEQQLAEQASEPVRARAADTHADQRERHPLPQHEPRYLTARRAERDANAQLARPQAHRVRDHAVDPHRRQHQRDRREDAEKRRVESRP